jgi:hypothetical protein
MAKLSPRVIQLARGLWGDKKVVEDASVLVRDWKGGDYRDMSYSAFLREAKGAGHDSAVLLNTYDGGPQDNIFVAFDPRNIRSVNARFDPASGGVRTSSRVAPRPRSGSAHWVKARRQTRCRYRVSTVACWRSRLTGLP